MLLLVDREVKNPLEAAVPKEPLAFGRRSETAGVELSRWPAYPNAAMKTMPDKIYCNAARALAQMVDRLWPEGALRNSPERANRTVPLGTMSEVISLRVQSLRA